MIFSLSLYLFSVGAVIAQSSPIGYDIITVNATDGDEQGTDNSDIFFTLVDPSLPFTINSSTGLLSTRQASPDLMGQVYNVQVVAADMGSPPQSSTGTIIVDVAPPNSHAPVFSFTELAFIGENTSPALNFYTFVVTDDDTGNEGEVAVMLLPGEYSSNFTLSTSGAIGETQVILTYNGPPFDRERISNFTLEFQADDQGNQLFRRSTTASLTVEVVDDNDNPPSFVGAPYTAMVSEGAAVGYVVATAVTVDPDQISSIAYSSDFTGGEFVIDGNSGNITVNSPLRVSTQDFYQFPITASDGAFTVNTYINITVTEVNDNVPMFEQALPTTIAIPEDTPTGSTVLNFTVTDADTGISGEITLSLMQTDNIFASGMYSTDEYYIYTQRMVDFEVW